MCVGCQWMAHRQSHSRVEVSVIPETPYLGWVGCVARSVGAGPGGPSGELLTARLTPVQLSLAHSGGRGQLLVQRVGLGRFVADVKIGQHAPCRRELFEPSDFEDW